MLVDCRKVSICEVIYGCFTFNSSTLNYDQFISKLKMT